jgi:hypothetical protein
MTEAHPVPPYGRSDPLRRGSGQALQTSWRGCKTSPVDARSVAVKALSSSLERAASRSGRHCFSPCPSRVSRSAPERCIFDALHPTPRSDTVRPFVGEGARPEEREASRRGAGEKGSRSESGAVPPLSPRSAASAAACASTATRVSRGRRCGRVLRGCFGSQETCLRPSRRPREKGRSRPCRASPRSR